MIDKHTFIEAVKDGVAAEIIHNKPLIIAGNWKMNMDRKRVHDFLDRLKVIRFSDKNQVLLFPPSVYLYQMQTEMDRDKAGYGVQNFHYEKEGAYTGELSINMVKDLGCSHALIGHSERRQYFGDDDEKVNRKVKAALAADLFPVICVGEHLEEREQKRYEAVLERQIKKALEGVKRAGLQKVIIAYEPVWAIGTGKVATPEQVGETHRFIRRVLTDMFGSEALKVPILYGGSVKPGNARELAVIGDVGGFLIGGASLKIEDFGEIIRLLD